MRDCYVAIVFVALVTAIMFLAVGFIGADMNIQDYKEDIDWYNGELIDANEETNEWKCKYDNYQCPECPEPETIYTNTTIIEYIYKDNILYLDNVQFDITGDGKVDYNDVCDILHYINHGLKSAEELFYNLYPNGWQILYDVDRNGMVNLADVELVMEYSD